MPDGETHELTAEEAKEEEEGKKLARPQLFIFNIILTLAVIICLIFLPLPSYLIFMIGCAIALFVNYNGSKLQNKIIKSHSGPAIMMASTLFAAGVFLGVMEDSGIMDHIKASFFWVRGVSIICLLAGLVFGVLKL